MVRCNGTKAQAEAWREELSLFRKSTLHLERSKDKTKITHLNDGFKCLGVWSHRATGPNGMKTKVTIPKEAMDKFKSQTDLALAPASAHDSVASKLLARHRRLRGWCRSYQSTSRAGIQFRRLEHRTFWGMAPWVGRQCTLRRMSAVRRRFNRDHTFGTETPRLLRLTEFPTRQSKHRFLKPNPYLTQERKREREELPIETDWTGDEARPGMADLRPLIIERDEYTGQSCGDKVPVPTAAVDHIRPVKRDKRPIDANVEENLWPLCIPCHKEKTQVDRQGESRMR